jgi:hypothetical protein
MARRKAKRERKYHTRRGGVEAWRRGGVEAWRPRGAARLFRPSLGRSAALLSSKPPRLPASCCLRNAAIDSRKNTIDSVFFRCAIQATD